MSTKIYDAFHITDPARAWELLWYIEDRAREKVDALLRAHYLHLVVNMDSDAAEYRAALGKHQGHEAGFRLRRAHDTIREGYRTNCTSGRRDEYSLDVTVALYPHKGQMYLRTFCEPISAIGGALDFVRELPGVEDFHYQNSTDKPDDISEDDWARREAVWDEITKHEGVGRHVALDIVCWHGFYRIDPWFELAREWHKEPPELPIREEVWARKLRKLRPDADVRAAAGLISMDGATVVRKVDDKQWISTVQDVEKTHPSLNHAADNVYFELMPELHKSIVRQMMGRFPWTNACVDTEGRCSSGAGGTSRASTTPATSIG